MGKITREDRIVIKALLMFIMKKLLKICITPLLVVCSLHVPKIVEFYLCIQMLPSKNVVGLTLAGPPCKGFQYYSLVY